MKQFLYFITESDGRVRQIQNGVVSSLNKKTPLPNTPIGWQEILILWERNMTRWGQVRNFSLPLGFVTDGAKILRNDYYKFNIDRQLFLLIKRRVCEVDPVYYRDYYKQLYKGEIDFSTFEDQPGESKVEINIMEGGLSKLIKAQENTKYFIPFDEDAVNVLMDGILLNGVYNYFIPENQSLGTFFLGMNQLPSDSQVSGIGLFDVIQETTSFSSGDNGQKTQYFGVITHDIDNVNLSGVFRNIQQGATFPVVVTLVLQIWNTITQTARLDVDLAPNEPYTPGHDINIDATFDLKEGDRLFIKKIFRFSESELTLTLKSSMPDTTVKGFKEYDAFKKICLKIGIPEDKIISATLQVSTLILTSGDGLRVIEGAGITTSFNDIVKNADVNHFTGVQIKDTVELEGRDTYFVQDSIDPAVELGNSKDLKVNPAIDLMYSSIKVGWQEQDSSQVNDVNGKFDFNGFHIYTTPIKRVSKEMDLQSPYKAGPFEIEILRINLDGKETSGSNTDNNVFVLDCVVNVNPVQNVLLSFIASGNYIVFRALPKIAVGTVFSILSTVNNNFTYTVTAVEDLGTTQTVHTNITITISEPVVLAQLTFVSGQVYLLDRSVVPDSGVPDVSSIFNVRLRPSELMKKHYRWIRSYLYGYDADEIEFQSSNRNSGLVIAGLTDGRDVVINAMGDRIFKPQYLEFTTKVPISLQDTLESSPNKCFAMEWIDNRFTGFLWKAGLAPNSRQPQVYKLLLTEENDQKDLIS